MQLVQVLLQYWLLYDGRRRQSAKEQVSRRSIHVRSLPPSLIRFVIVRQNRTATVYADGLCIYPYTHVQLPTSDTTEQTPLLVSLPTYAAATTTEGIRNLRFFVNTRHCCVGGIGVRYD